MIEKNSAQQASFSSSGITWIKLSVIYLIIGIAMGIVMGATENFTLRPVHAHVNLLGWATMALAGLIYTAFPQAAQSRLAKIHFWLLNISMPVMMCSLTILLLGNRAIVPVLALSEIVAAASVLAFTINIFTNLKHKN